MTKATLKQAQETLKLITQSGIKREELQLLLESGKFSKLLKSFIGVKLTTLLKNFVECKDPGISSFVYNLYVDYQMTEHEMIKAGEFDCVNEEEANLSKRFEIIKHENKEVGFVLIHYNKTVSYSDVLFDFQKRGLRPVEYAEFLTFAAATYSSYSSQIKIVSPNYVNPKRKYNDCFLALVIEKNTRILNFLARAKILRDAIILFDDFLFLGAKK